MGWGTGTRAILSNWCTGTQTIFISHGMGHRNTGYIYCTLHGAQEHGLYLTGAQEHGPGCLPKKLAQEHKGTWYKYTAGLYDPPDVGSVSAGLLLLPGSCSTPARRIISKKRGILGELKHMASGTLHTSGTLGLWNTRFWNTGIFAIHLTRCNSSRLLKAL